MIKVKNISFSYSTNNIDDGGEQILENINFDIHNGEFVSLLGPSGCGKTTLANVLAGYLPTQKGKVFINDIEVQGPRRNRIMVNQENDLFSWMTVWGNMKLANNTENEIAGYLELVGLDAYKDYYPNRLSGGMKKRLSLARALVINPDFLILDEPFSSLDYYTREALQLELDKIFLTTKKTTLLVTHDIEEAIFLSDRVIVLGGSVTTIVKTIVIDFPHPRDRGIRNTKKFHQYYNEIKHSYFPP